MGVVTGGGGGGGTPFNGGTITEGLVIADPDASETQLTLAGTGSTGATMLINASAVHTTFTVDSDGIATFQSDDDMELDVTGVGDTGAGFSVTNLPTRSSFEAASLSSGSDAVVKDATSAIIAAISTRFGVMTALHAAPADNAISAGQCVLWFDQTNGASKLMVKGKSANGTVVTGSLALA